MQSETSVETGDLIDAERIGEVTGEWRAYSQMAQVEFGTLTVSGSQVAFSQIGTAAMRVEGTHAVLQWDQDYPALEGICANGPPAAIELRLGSKDEFLASDIPGETLEISFYSSADNLAMGRDDNLDLCRTSTWERERAP